ncbi:MAG: universal stress protein [Candidatus Melainabacteria bacterium]|jgi:nucleotide-binding universal stress UspA family protein|nr:universal stress protein [Candidatus Melainabacteria bacterium]
MKILIACDGSDHSEAAIEETLRSPWPANTSFQILSVVDTAFSPPPTVHRMLTAAQSVVDLSVERLKESLPEGTSVIGTVGQGNPKSEILECAERWPADLLIVGSRGLKGIKKVVLGSVSHTLVISASCSVRIVRRRDSNAEEATRLFLAIDDSPFSDHVVERISSRPWKEDTSIMCVTAVPSLAEYMNEAQDTREIQALEDFRNKQVGDAKEHLKRLCAVLNKNLPQAHVFSEILTGDPREVVVDSAKNWHADLIVSGCKGKGWVDRMLIGSVSEAIAERSECSVEVIKR